MSTNKRDDQEEALKSDWLLGTLLGKGHCGTVHMASPTNPRSPRFKNFPSIMAVKSTRGPNIADLEHETSLLLKLSYCPHVIQYLGVEETVDEDDAVVSLNLFLEYASSGTLGRLIAGSAGLPLDLRLLRRHARSVLEGVKRIHDLGYVHCDLKPENILLVANGGKGELGFTAKVADLGMAKLAQPEGGSQCRIVKGTAVYLPPEAAKFKIQEQASDVWAIGCIVLKMFGGKLPWEGGNIGKNELRRKIAMERPVLPAGLSDEAKDFLERCFVRNPRDRVTAEELLRHPFVCDLEAKEEEEEEGDADDGVNNRSFSFMLVRNDCSHNVKSSESVTIISNERKEASGYSSNGTTLREFGERSLLQIQNIFRRFFTH